MSRSGFVAHAIDAYLTSLSEQEMEDRWAQSYSDVPQHLAADALELLDALPEEKW